MSKLVNVEGNIFSVTFDGSVNVDRIQRNLLDLADSGLVTFGHINTEILPFENVDRNDLCLFDDQTLGLTMPDTWYLNKGTDALSISMYYNFLNYKEMAKEGVLFTKNKRITDDYGRVAMIEIYWQPEIESFLKENEIPYFGTPKTLTECMRVLEGWNLKLVPRLYTYVGFARQIHIWCKENFPGYKMEAWGLTREENQKILNANNTTNVREGIKYYWQNVLLKKEPPVSPGDVEIDVLCKDFYEKRQPAIILIGEDIFSHEPTSERVVFRRFSCPRQAHYAFRSFRKSEIPIKNARLAQKRFPNAKIVILQTREGLPNFSMCKMDELKKGISLEVGQIAELLCELNPYR